MKARKAGDVLTVLGACPDRRAKYDGLTVAGALRVLREGLNANSDEWAGDAKWLIHCAGAGGFYRNSPQRCVCRFAVNFVSTATPDMVLTALRAARRLP